MPKTETLDEELVGGLKMAKTKRCYFALVVKGASDGALIVMKMKVPPALIAAAKKKCGGSAVIKGAVFFEDGQYIFEMGKEPAATMPNALKVIAKRDAGMSIHAICRVGTSPDLLEEGDGNGQATATTVTPTKDTSTTETPKTGTTVPGAEKWAAAQKTWEQASAVAISSVEKLISALEATGDDVAFAIAGIMDKAVADFPETLGDALDGLNKAAKAGDVDGASQWRMKSEIAIKACLAYLGNNSKTFDGCEDNPFGINIQIRAPLTEALKQVLLNVKA